jgi:hypothetical protein
MCPCQGRLAGQVARFDTTTLRDAALRNRVHETPSLPHFCARQFGPPGQCAPLADQRGCPGRRARLQMDNTLASATFYGLPLTQARAAPEHTDI